MKRMLPFLAAIGLSFGEPNEAARLSIARYRDHESIEFAADPFVVIHQGSVVVSGFGKIESLPKREGCRNEGHDCYWVVLAGKKYPPESTDSISVNEVPGLARLGEWRFTLADGPIKAFSKFPFGDPESAWVEGKTYPLAEPEERQRFGERLKAVPEAYAAWKDDPLWAIRYFDRAGKSDSVQDTTYASEDQDDAFPASRLLLPGPFLKRLAKNANDAYALGRLSEIYCQQKDYGAAEKFADSLRSTHPGHFRYFLVRGLCEEQRASFTEANRDYGQASRAAPPFLLPSIFAAIESNASAAKYDSVYAADARHIWKLEAGVGLGFPYAFAGAELSVDLRLGSFMLALSASDGLIMAATGNPIPVLAARLYFPGKKWRPYLGVSDWNLFEAKKKNDLRFIGPDIGMNWDIGEPLGFMFRFGIGDYFFPSYMNSDKNHVPPEKKRVSPESQPFPFLGFAYVF